jgi:hypothetical protein
MKRKHEHASSSDAQVQTLREANLSESEAICRYFFWLHQKFSRNEDKEVGPGVDGMTPPGLVAVFQARKKVAVSKSEAAARLATLRRDRPEWAGDVFPPHAFTANSNDDPSDTSTEIETHDVYVCHTGGTSNRAAFGQC